MQHRTRNILEECLNEFHCLVQLSVNGLSKCQEPLTPPDTDNISEDDQDILKAKIQTEADLSTDWVSDNKLVCSRKKTKLMIIGTPELKQSRIASKNISFQITVAGLALVKNFSV